jgi:hypothetical protein
MLQRRYGRTAKRRTVSLGPLKKLHTYYTMGDRHISEGWYWEAWREVRPGFVSHDFSINGPFASKEEAELAGPKT